jgi:hypothetical protein
MERDGERERERIGGDIYQPYPLWVSHKCTLPLSRRSQYHGLAFRSRI